MQSSSKLRISPIPATITTEFAAIHCNFTPWTPLQRRMLEFLRAQRAWKKCRFEKSTQVEHRHRQSIAAVGTSLIVECYCSLELVLLAPSLPLLERGVISTRGSYSYLFRINLLVHVCILRKYRRLFSLLVNCQVTCAPTWVSLLAPFSMLGFSCCIESVL